MLFDFNTVTERNKIKHTIFHYSRVFQGLILPLTLRQQSSLFLSNRLSFGIKKLSLPFYK